jgi:hypothetical protein
MSFEDWVNLMKEKRLIEAEPASVVAAPIITRKIKAQPARKG